MNNSVEINNLTKSYMTRIVLKDISINFECGKIYGLLGPNGNGKTTIMKLIAGLHRETRGEILINGQKISCKTKAKVAFMPTENFLIESFKVSKCIDYYNDMYSDFNKEDCYDLMDKLSVDTTLKISQLSTGLTAKVKLALTLARNADIYMFDEPLNGIDFIARSLIIDTIVSVHDENKTFIISSHIVDEIEQLFDNVVFIKNTQIALQGDAEDLRVTNGKSIANIYMEVYTDATIN